MPPFAAYEALIVVLFEGDADILSLTACIFGGIR